MNDARLFPHATRCLAALALAIAMGACGGDETPSSPETPATTPKGAVATPLSPDSEKANVDHDQPLVVWLEGEPFEGPAPLTVEFEADLFGGVRPLKITWTFGDGETSSEENPRHTYTEPGTYEVRLEVTDSREDEPDSDWDSVEVVVSK